MDFSYASSDVILRFQKFLRSFRDNWIFLSRKILIPETMRTDKSPSISNGRVCGNSSPSNEILKNKFYIGSFQRDSEGSDTNKPKLSKGPDRFIKIVDSLRERHKDIHIILTGKRRDYLINELNKLEIEFSYFEMANFKTINELYNCLDLYIVASRFEGGPQSILECGVTNTPIISTDVGVASEILSPESIFDMSNYMSAEPNLEIAFKNSQKYEMEKSFSLFHEMFKGLHES